MTPEDRQRIEQEERQKYEEEQYRASVRRELHSHQSTGRTLFTSARVVVILSLVIVVLLGTRKLSFWLSFIIGGLLLPIMFLIFPWLMMRIARAFNNDVLSKMTREEAEKSYRVLNVFREALLPLLAEAPSGIRRFLTGWWLNWLQRGLEEIEDVMETMAWGFDADLRGMVQAAVQELHR